MASGNKLAKRFNPASGEKKHRTIATIEGEVGTGKTYFCLTAPGPILVQDIDQGTEGVIEKFVEEGKEIYHEQYVWNPGEPDEDTDNLKEEAELKEAAIEIRNKFEKDLFYAIDNGVRSSIIDTESRIWQVYRYAEFGGPNGEQRDYDKLNLRFEAIIHKAKERDVNLFLIRSMKDRWGMYGKPKADGRKSFAKSGREVWGYEHLSGCVFIELTFIHDAEDEAAPYKIKVGKCRHNKDLQFSTQDLGKDRFTFPQFGTLLIDGSSEEDWS